MKWHSVWISDTHLGSKFSKTEELLNFLKELECKNLFIVGDFIDFWTLKQYWFWDEKSSTVIDTIKSLSNQGFSVKLLKGNHDDIFDGQSHFNGLTLLEDYIYTSLKGKRYLVWHGDKLDIFQKGLLKYVSAVGGLIYEALIAFRIYLDKNNNKPASKSFSSWFKIKVKLLVESVTFYKLRLYLYLKKYNLDGVICGHNHNPKLSSCYGKEYLNCGDWMESCSYITEDLNGDFQLCYF